MLNGQELVDRKVITGEINESNIAQHGIDLNLIAVKSLHGVGLIPAQGKTILPEYETVKPVEGNGSDRAYWYLEPGTYDITFLQGCDIPSDLMLLIRQRSSLLRNGAILHSSVFDAGFKTDRIGTVITLHRPLRIEVGARVCQIYGHACTPVENLYDGQFQGDKQRKS